MFLTCSIIGHCGWIGRWVLDFNSTSLYNREFNYQTGIRGRIILWPYRFRELGSEYVVKQTNVKLFVNNSAEQKAYNKRFFIPF